MEFHSAILAAAANNWVAFLRRYKSWRLCNTNKFTRASMMRVYVLGSYANVQQQNTEKYFQFIVYWLGQSQKLSQKCEYYAAISRPIQLQLSYSLLLAQCRVRIYLKSIIYICNDFRVTSSSTHNFSNDIIRIESMRHKYIYGEIE